MEDKYRKSCHLARLATAAAAVTAMLVMLSKRFSRFGGMQGPAVGSRKLQQ